MKFDQAHYVVLSDIVTRKRFEEKKPRKVSKENKSFEIIKKTQFTSYFSLHSIVGGMVWWEAGGEVRVLVYLFS